MKKILVISYTFPPQNGIGGRRWAKFCKELKRKGHQIKVITSETKDSTSSPWTKDISTYKKDIIRIPSRHPYALSIAPKNFYEKLNYKIALQRVKLTTKGNYYDKAALWKKPIQKEIRKSIQEGYNNIIITVAPFKTALWASEIKKEFPNTNFIVDFRDPWIEEITSKQSNIFSTKRIKSEINAEKKIIESFDYIVSVATQMTENFKKKYPFVPGTKFKTIPNGYDEDDLERKQTTTNNTIIFAGTFYNDAIPKFKQFTEALKHLKKDHPNLLQEINFSFYSNLTFEYQHLIEGLPITIHQPVPLNTIHKLISQSKACMLFLSNDINYSLSTKFCEYIAYEKPVIVFSNNGYTARFVNENGIGYTIDDKNIEKDLINSLTKLKTDIFTSNFDYQKYNIANIVEKYEAILS